MREKDQRKYAKKLIKLAKKSPECYTKGDVRFAKLIKSRLKKKDDKTNVRRSVEQMEGLCKPPMVETEAKHRRMLWSDTEVL